MKTGSLKKQLRPNRTGQQVKAHALQPHNLKDSGNSSCWPCWAISCCISADKNDHDSWSHCGLHLDKRRVPERGAELPAEHQPTALEMSCLLRSTYTLFLFFYPALSQTQHTALQDDCQLILKDLRLCLFKDDKLLLVRPLPVSMSYL